MRRLERLELAERSDRGVASLSSDRQQAVKAHLMGFDVHEIMRLRGWAYNAARNLVARGMTDLREFLSADVRK